MTAVSQPFVSDIKELRRRAKEQIERGAVTQNYGGDVKQTIDLLQTALATEIVCVLRYTMHNYRGGRNRQREHQGGVRASTRSDEQGTCEQIAERINQLGGDAEPQPGGARYAIGHEYGEAENLIDMIKENLIAERIAVEHYRDLDPLLRRERSDDARDARRDPRARGRARQRHARPARRARRAGRSSTTDVRAIPVDGAFERVFDRRRPVAEIAFGPRRIRVHSLTR